MSGAVPSLEEIKQKILFVPLETKEALHDWVAFFLGIDLPDCIVDEGSNSSPMDLVWEVYDKARRGDPTFDFVLSYASRDSGKTLAAAILEVLMLCHLGRNVVHMAAIEQQAQKCAEYAKRFLRSRFLSDYVVGDSKRSVKLCRHYDAESGTTLSPRAYAALKTEAERERFTRVEHEITIIVCTLQSTNGQHGAFVVVDELDVVSNPAAYEEAFGIPTPSDGKIPVTLLTSTRKFRFGLVQKEIDRAGESGLQIRHWNMIDVTAPCPASRHRPDLPRLPIYRSDETLQAISEVDHQALLPDQQKGYVRDEGYTGCLQNCKLFAVCKGRLATHQKNSGNLVKPVEHVQSLFRKYSLEMAKAQLLCWKPSSEGMVYPRLDRSVHMLTAAQMAEKLTGERYDERMTKAQLVALMKARGVTWYAGMDWGYTHNFACSVGARDGARMFVVEAIEQPELELGQKLELCDLRLRPYEPTIFPDPAYPSDIKTFKRHGYRMKSWNKGKGSVSGGIEVVRLKLWPAVGKPELFFLAGDEGCELLFKRLQAYHYVLNSAGDATETPSDEDDDLCDGFRYMVMNVFAPKGKITLPKPEETNPLTQPRQTPSQKQAQQQMWEQVMGHVFGGAPPDPPPDDGAAKPRGKKGSFFYDV